MLNKGHAFTWFAALRWVEGEGWVPNGQQFFFPEPKNYVVAYDLDSVPDNRLEKYLSQASHGVREGGFLCLGVNAAKQIPIPPGFFLAEDSITNGRRFQAWRKLVEPELKPLPHIIIFRDGMAHGDALQASAVAEHYVKSYPDHRIAIMVRDNAVGTVKNTPGASVIKIEGCIQNNDIPLFVEFWASRCQLFVNLDWTVEGGLLKYQSNRDYYWNHQQRKIMCNGNYNKNTAQIAGMSENLKIKYYPAPEDEEFLKLFKPSKPYFTIVMRGSAVHKWYPHMGDLVVQLLLRHPHDIVLLGDPSSYSLAEGIYEKVKWAYGDTSRIHNFVGKNKIGGSILMAKESACCIGPETGVLLALAHEPTPKVMIISQSSYGNFDDFVNCNMLQGNVPCAPCHRHHNDFSHCVQDQATGASACQAAIEPASIVMAVDHILNEAQPNHQCSAPKSDLEPVPAVHDTIKPPPKTSRGRGRPKKGLPVHNTRGSGNQSHVV